MTTETRRVRLVLPASGTAPGTVELEPRPRRQRTLRVAVILAATLVLTPAVFFIPPHFLWPLVVLVLGAYFARREWRGEYVVLSFAGECPRCGDPLTVAAGSRIRSGQRVECYGCHREPELMLETAQVSAAAESAPADGSVDANE